MQEAVLHHTAGTADTSAAEPAHDPQALRALSQQALAAGRLEEARELLEEALASAPEEAVAEITEHLELVLASLGEEHD